MSRQVDVGQADPLPANRMSISQAQCVRGKATRWHMPPGELGTPISSRLLKNPLFGPFPLPFFRQPGVEAIPIDDEPHVAALGDDLDLVADGNVEADLPPVDFRHLDLGRNFHARRRRGPVIDVDVDSEAALAVIEVRGQGFLLGLKCTQAVPNGELVKALVGQKLLTVQAGDNVVRLLPPLIIGDAEIDAACEKLEAACAAVAPASAETA